MKHWHQEGTEELLVSCVHTDLQGMELLWKQDILGCMAELISPFPYAGTQAVKQNKKNCNNNTPKSLTWLYMYKLSLDLQIIFLFFNLLLTERWKVAGSLFSLISQE